VAARGRERLAAEIARLAEGPTGEEAQALARQLLAAHDAGALVAGLVERMLAARPRGEALTPVALSTSSGSAASSSAASSAKAGPARAGARGERGEMVLFEVNLGAKDGAEPNWILPLVCRRGAITRREIGAIRVARDRTVFEVASQVASEFAANAAEVDPRAPHVRIVPASGELPDRAPPRSPHPRRAGRPHQPRSKRR
jgi:ATP-dependent RNA helicase DeaD